MPTNDERGIDLLETYAGPMITRLMRAAEDGAEERPPTCDSAWRSEGDSDPQDWDCSREPQHAGLHAAIAIEQTADGVGFVAVICAIWSDTEALVR